MRLLVFFIMLLCPGLLVAQYKYAFASPVSNELHLLKSGDKTILVYPLDLGNQSQRWITFDSTLTATSAKKLVTPGAENIISQSYLEGDNKIIRIDQTLANGQLEVNGFVFDVRGNLVLSKQLVAFPIPGRRAEVKRFTITQSPDKKVVLLTNASVTTDLFNMLAIVFDDQLNVGETRNISIPYDSKLFDLYSPVVSNTQTLFIPVVDRFKSYKLSGLMHGYVLGAGEESPTKIQFDFERQKVKNLTFQFTGDSLVFSALFSRDKSKGNVAGVLFSGYDLGTKQKLAQHEFVFDNKTKADLKKVYGNEARKGNLLNYLSLVPETFFTGLNHGYATLTQDQQTPMYVPRSSPAPLPTLDALRQEQAYINALVRRTPPGSTGPLNAAEAATYAAIHPRNNQQVDKIEGLRPTNAASQQFNSKVYDKNLLFFNFDKAVIHHRFIKMKYSVDEDYKFFTYIPAENGYGALHYVVPNFTRPYLKRVVIDNAGSVVNNKVYEDKTKIILADYPWLVNKESLVAFYEDRITGQMGLVKIRL